MKKQIEAWFWSLVVVITIIAALCWVSPWIGKLERAIDEILTGALP